MQQINIAGKSLTSSRPAFVMAILNVTPDSFFQESRGGLEKALQLIDQGADILDIGGESTRPGYTPVSAEEEIGRILPVIKEIRKKSDIVISVDTQKFEVFKAAFEEGAQIWNDVSFLEQGKEALDFIARKDISYILMHTGSANVESMNSAFEKKIKILEDHGVNKEKIILDPGIGFGKSNEESIELIKNTDKIGNGDLPLLMALSRKRCIGQMTGRETQDRLSGTLAANILAVQKGAKIVRVHDLCQTIDALNVMKYLQ
ncbi:MAG: dihydropteroate synthase [Treponema sp.]|nr:dihydropteroate synthase [Treponema sp.]